MGMVWKAYCTACGTPRELRHLFGCVLWKEKIELTRRLTGRGRERMEEAVFGPWGENLEAGLGLFSAKPT